MKNFILLFSAFLFITNVSFAQNETKYSPLLKNKLETNQLEEYTVWIFFADKGNDINQKLAVAKQKVSSRALERRKKLLKNKPLVSHYDIVVSESYVETVAPFLNKIRHQSKWLNAISAEVSSNQLANIASFGFVKSIDIVRTRKYDEPKNNETLSKSGNKNPNYNLNYGPSITQLEQINVPLVHDLGYEGNGLLICLMDSGFNNLEHQNFSNIDIVDAYDFVNDDPNVDDEGDMGTGNHGTMTLSTIGGFEEGQLIGPAYGASYLLAKTENTDSETQVEEDNWVAAAEWAEGLGVDITSTSLGYIYFDDGTGYDPSEMDGNTAVITIAADILAGLGVLVVNSAGNSGGGTTTIGAPADGDYVLAVGAVDSNGIRTGFSSVGPTADGRIKPEVMAMGSGVVVAAPPSGNSYTTASGTSFSCPLTAGAAALLWEMVPTASNMEIFEALKMTASNAATPNNQYGWGIIDVYAAFEYLALPQIDSTPLNDTENLLGPYMVTAEVTSNYDMVADSPKVHYRVDGGAWIEIIMTNTTGDTYIADILGNGSQSTYDYYIEAENVNAIVSLPEDAPTNHFSFSAIIDTQAPQIVHNPIAEYYGNLWGQAQVITVLTDNIGIDTANSYVEWKINGTTQASIYFTNTNGDNYSAKFPYSEIAIGDIIEYRLIVQDLSNAQNTSTFPTSGFHSFTITDRISFEQNQFSHNWTFSGNADWQVSSNEAQDGIYSAQAGSISDNQTSSISLDFSCDESGTVSFYRKVSSESAWDFLKFYVNGSEEASWSGEIAWSEYTYTVTPGSYNLKWEYYKDGSQSNGSDTAWIDNITFPGNASIGVVDITDATFSIYPNPAIDNFHIRFHEKFNKQVSVSMYNYTGKLIKTIENYAINSAIDVSNMTGGLYQIRIRTDGETKYGKLIIEK